MWPPFKFSTLPSDTKSAEDKPSTKVTKPAITPAPSKLSKKEKKQARKQASEILTAEAAFKTQAIVPSKKGTEHKPVPEVHPVVVSPTPQVRQPTAFVKTVLLPTPVTSAWTPGSQQGFAFKSEAAPVSEPLRSVQVQAFATNASTSSKTPQKVPTPVSVPAPIQPTQSAPRPRTPPAQPVSHRRIPLQELEEGMPLKGTVKTVKEGLGAFIDVNCTRDGLLHISCLEIKQW